MKDLVNDLHSEESWLQVRDAHLDQLKWEDNFFYHKYAVPSIEHKDGMGLVYRDIWNQVTWMLSALSCLGSSLYIYFFFADISASKGHITENMTTDSLSSKS